MSDDALEAVILPRLEGVRSLHGYYMARCPAHDDTRASLSVQRGTSHPVVMYCHTGCEPRAIVDALGLDWEELCAPREEQPRRGEWTPHGEATAVYPYHDETGVLLYEVLRTAGKEFPVRVPDTSKRSGYRWSLKGVRRVLYRLPEVLAAAQAGRTVYVVEGEKDADRLRALGYTATCNPGGAGSWREDYAQHLAGAHVVIVADRDEPDKRGRRAGWEHARTVGKSLESAAASVRAVQAAEGKDACDHLAAGYTVADLVGLDPATGHPASVPESSHDRPTVDPTAGHEPEAPETPPEEAAGPVEQRAAEIRAALLDSEGMDALPSPEPLIDGALYLDSLAWLHGKPGHGKSFVALDWAAHVADGMNWEGRACTKGEVLYLVAEGASGVAQRKRAWEATHGRRMGVTFLPMAVQMMSPSEVDAFAMVAAELRPMLVVIDTQARVTVGADENSSQDMGRFVAAADRIRQATGACVLLVHHEARSGDTLRGSTAMEGAATSVVRATKDGPLIRLDCPKQKDAPPFDPILLELTPVDLTEGGEYVQGAVISSHGGGGTTRELTDSERAILNALRDDFGTDGASSTNLKEVSGVPKSSFNRAANSLVKRGFIAQVGTTHRHRYVLSDTEPDGSRPTRPKPSHEAEWSRPTVPHPFRGGTSGTNSGPDPGEEPPARLRVVGEDTIDADTGEIRDPPLTPCATDGCRTRINPTRYTSGHCETHGGRDAGSAAQGGP